jgi:hypothetical protein
MDDIKHASRLKDWEEQYSWETCKANREEFGYFIADFLTSDSRVINLNGIYGSGKTEFIRRLYVHLAKQKHPVVYIDVWESDFSNNPLAVICSELLQQIELIFETKAPSGKTANKKSAREAFNKLKHKLGLCLKYVEAAAALTCEPNAISAAKTISTAVNATPDFNTQTTPTKLVEAVQKNHIGAVQAIKDIKQEITFLSELIELIYELKIPIVVLIDELDRCRPTYAIEVLESIKHFFETKGCTFLVATNTEVLEHSVKSIYGGDFDAKLYLRRFFDRKVTLPQVSILDYMNARELNFENYEAMRLKLCPFHGAQQSNIALFAALFESNKIELRGVEQLLNRFFASLDYIASRTLDSEVVLNTVVLMVGLIEQHLEKTELRERTNTKHLSPTIKFPADLLKMTEYMFCMVTKVMSKREYSPTGNTMIYTQPKDMLLSQATALEKIELPIGAGIASTVLSEIIAFRDDVDFNYWMWKDYQKIIELSGHIE